MNTNDTEPTDTTAARDRETPPRPVTVELPGECPEGQEWVAAFRQPIPMLAMAKLCTALVEAYGADAKINPQGQWVAVSGTTCQDADGNARELLKNFRVCEVMPDSAEDGGAFKAKNHDDAARQMAERHPSVLEYPTLYVWPDGETPGPDNLHGVRTNTLNPPTT